MMIDILVSCTQGQFNGVHITLMNNVVPTVTKAKVCHHIKYYLCFAQVVLLLQLSNIVLIWFK